MNTKQLKQRIADLRAAMGREWRLYGRCSAALRKMELQLTARLNLEAANVRKKVVERSRQVWKYIDQRVQALREANPIAYIRIYMPRAYDWGIGVGDDDEVFEAQWAEYQTKRAAKS